MINSLFRSLLMQGAGEEPVPGRWEYADYIYPKTTATHGIELVNYRLSNKSNNLTIDFKIPLSTTSSTNIYLIKNNSFIIKPYYNSSNVLTLYITTSNGGNFTITSNTGTDDGTEVHRVTIKNGYVWLDKQLINNTQAITTNLGSRPAIGVNFTSDCRIYNIFYYKDTETHSQVLFSKTHGFECPCSYFGSSEMTTVNTVQAAEAWVGNFDYEPEYVDYIKPQTVDGFKLLNLYIGAYPKVKLSCEVSNDYNSLIYSAGYWIDHDDYYERGYNQLQGGLGTAVAYQQSPNQYTFSSVATGTKFTFDNFSGTPKMNGATGVSSNIGYDRTWTEDDEGVIKSTHYINAGTKVYSFKIQAYSSGTTYDCLPVIPHYNAAWGKLGGNYVDGYLMDKNTGFRFMPVADVSTPDMQLVSYFKNPVDDPTITVGSALQYYDNFLDPNYPAPAVTQFNIGDVVEIKISDMSDLASYKSPGISLFVQSFGYVDSSTQLRTNYTEKMYGDTSYKYYYLGNGVNRSGGMVYASNYYPFRIQKVSAKIEYIKVYDLNGSLVKWYVPAKKTTTDAIGWYDVYDTTFYECRRNPDNGTPPSFVE